MKFILSPFVPLLAEIKYGTRTKSNQKKVAASLSKSISEIFYLVFGSLVFVIIFLLGAICA